MKLILHVFRKDLFHTFWLLLLWFALLVGRFAFTDWLFFNGNQAGLMMGMWLPWMLDSLTSLFLLVLIPLIIQQDSLVGTTAFWLTRPVSRPVLLSAKMLYGITILTSAVLVQTLSMAILGVSPHDIYCIDLQYALTLGGFITWIALFAALTPSFEKFAIAGAVTIAVSWGLYIFVVFFGSIFISSVGIISFVHLHSPRNPFESSLTEANSVEVAVAVTTFAYGILALAYQFLSRRLTISIVLVVLGLCISPIIQGFWQWNFFQQPATTITTNASKDILQHPAATISSTDTSSFTFSLMHPQKKTLGSSEYAIENVEAGIEAKNLLPENFIEIDEIHPDLITSSGQKVNIIDSSASLKTSRMLDRGGNASLDYQAVEAALGNIHILNAGVSVPQKYEIFSISTDKTLLSTKAEFRFSAQLKYTIYRYTIADKLPLKEKTFFRNNLLLGKITHVQNIAQGISVSLNELHVKYWFMHIPPHDDFSLPFLGMPFDVDKPSVYVLVNGKRGEGFLPQGDDLSRIIFRLDKNLSMRSTTLTFQQEDENAGENAATRMNAAWFVDASLVRLEPTAIGEATAGLREDHFKINPDADNHSN